MIDRKKSMADTIKKSLKIYKLDILDESYKHNVPENAQTHFLIHIVSDDFQNVARIKRHRLIHQILHDEFSTGLHALSLHLDTCSEYEHRDKHDMTSPNCKGGYDKNN